jgi:hypothetical protein
MQKMELPILHSSTKNGQNDKSEEAKVGKTCDMHEEKP